MENELSSSIKTLQDQLTIARNEIFNLRKQIKNMNYLNSKEYNKILEKLNNLTCSNCHKHLDQNQKAEIIQNYQQIGQSTNSQQIEENNSFDMKSIGIIKTEFREKRGTPRQPGICPESTAKIILDKNVFTNPNHAIEGLEEFSHFWILFYFHKNNSNHIAAKVTPPRLNGSRVGVFSTRSPHRPNPIGLSLVKKISIQDYNIYFQGVDMIDSTPVLDIKPYIPMYDCPSEQVDMNSRVLDGQDDEDILSNEFLSIQIEQSTAPSCSSRSNESEREEPDGAEEINESKPSNLVSIAPWINNAPVKQLTVSFSDEAIHSLKSYKNDKWEETKLLITNILREDPRSIYLRSEKSNENYSFGVCDIEVLCKFNNQNASVIVLNINNMNNN